MLLSSFHETNYYLADNLEIALRNQLASLIGRKGALGFTSQGGTRQTTTMTIRSGFSIYGRNLRLVNEQSRDEFRHLDYGHIRIIGDCDVECDFDFAQHPTGPHDDRWIFCPSQQSAGASSTQTLRPSSPALQTAHFSPSQSSASQLTTPEDIHEAEPSGDEPVGPVVRSKRLHGPQSNDDINHRSESNSGDDGSDGRHHSSMPSSQGVTTAGNRPMLPPRIRSIQDSEATESKATETAEANDASMKQRKTRQKSHLVRRIKMNIRTMVQGKPVSSNRSWYKVHPDNNALGHITWLQAGVSQMLCGHGKIATIRRVGEECQSLDPKSVNDLVELKDILTRYHVELVQARIPDA